MEGAESSPRQRPILIVSGDEPLATVSQEVLSDLGYPAAVAPAAAAAIDWLQSNRADLLVVGTDLPSHGLELLEELDRRDLSLPFVAVGRAAGSGGLAALSAAGALEHLEHNEAYAGALPIVVRHALKQLESTSRLRRTRVALREERDRAERYLDLAGVVLLALDAQGRISRLNRKGCELLGVREEEVIGEDWVEVFVPSRGRAGARGVFRRLLAGEIGPDDRFESWVLTRAGEERLIAWHNAVLREPGGQATGTLSSGEDVTERRRAEEESAERAQLAALAAAVGLALSEGGSLPETLGRCAEAIRAGLGVSLAGVWVFDELESTLERVAHDGSCDCLTRGADRIPIGALAAELATWGPSPFPTSDERWGSWPCASPGPGDEALPGCLRLPLAIEGRLQGLLAVCSPTPLSARSLEAISGLAVKLALGIERLLTRAVLERFRHALDQAGEAIFVVDVAARKFVDVNETACRRLGYTRAELLARGPQDVQSAHPLSSEEDWEAHAALLRATPGPHLIEGLHRRQDGTTFPVDVSVQRSVDAGREYHVVVARDATERLRAEQALQHRITMERLVGRISTRFISIPLADLEQGIADALRETCEFTDVDRGNAVLLADDGETVASARMWHADHLEPCAGLEPGASLSTLPWLQDKLRTAEPVHIPSVARLDDAAAQERRLWQSLGVHSLVCVPLTLEGRLLGFLCLDSTRAERAWPEEDLHLLGLIAQIFANALERRRAEEESRLRQEQLVRADKLATLGTLVGGVAHEISNPNSCILLGAPLLATFWDGIQPLLDERARAGPLKLGGVPYDVARERVPILLKDIEEASERIRAIVGGLTAFARQDTEEEQEAVDLEEVVLAVGRILRKRLCDSSSRFSTHLDTPVPRVWGSFQRLEQVLANLLLNACEAIPDRQGEISVSLRHDPEGDLVILEVRDEGVGIPEQHLHRLCDPFFSTKRETGSTGLGLAIADGIVREHDGALSFASRPGAGTTVTVALPVQPDPPA